MTARTEFKTAAPVEEAREKFYCPVDKLYIRAHWRTHVELIEAFRLKEEFGPRKKYYSFKDSRRYLLSNGATLQLFQNSYCTDLQLNLTQWRLLKGLNRFLEMLMGPKYLEAKVTRIHCFIDVAVPLRWVSEAIRVARVTLAMRFKPSAITKVRAGTPEELTFTSGFGSIKRRSYVVYDSARKHGLPGPSTRFERRDNSSQATIINVVSELPRLAAETPFKSLSFGRMGSVEGLQGKDADRWDYLALKIASMGLDAALKELRRRNPKHFDRDYAKILKRIEYYDLDLNSIFQEHFKLFADRDLGPDELELLSMMSAERSER